MSNTLKIDGHTEEAKKLRMFPFTLAEEAKEWLYSLPAGYEDPNEEESSRSCHYSLHHGDRSFKKALIDLGASVSLMLLSIYKKLGIRVVQDTRITLQFVDHSAKKPYGNVEDVLVKIDKFVFPMDFVILEMPENEEIPLILGRPFLEIGRCLINIEEGTMTLKVYDEELKIDVRNTIKYKDDIDISHTIEVLDQVITYDSLLNAP
ncbi:uncharacterized protein LOC127122934 [Lathyrus oleraceus]|uniref:uncharacterized protein LOC127122934 n=1 Tax=Pisum sativum TaxID=3888 RepID=UPI0021CFF2E3|nr:uncharacterized protein LOC127122934 [Pisum sativum]